MRILVASEGYPRDVKFGDEKIFLSIIDSKRFKEDKIIERRREIEIEEDHFVTLGDPVDEIVKFSNALNVDFIIVDDINLGLNVSFRISKPVLILKCEDPFRKGLICYNPIFFNFAIKRMLSSLPFKELHVLHVLEPIFSQNSGMKRLIIDVKSLLNEVKLKVKRVKEVHVRVGDPANEILETAKELNVTCVVMSVGRTTEDVAMKFESSILVWRDLMKRNGFIQRV